MRHLVTGLAAILMIALPIIASAQESPLRRLDTSDDSRGWNAVGRLNIGTKGFCTGALIAPQLVLTAAHCLFDKDTGARADVAGIEFLAGWRNGRALAYRGVRRAVAHPDYVYSDDEDIARVAYDLALIELDKPVRLASVVPFETDAWPSKGDEVGVVSYAKDREDAPSLQEACHVLGRRPGVLVLSCSVDFGSSGAPVFAIRDGVARIVSVVSAKAEVDGEQVALGMALQEPIAVLMTALDGGGPGLLQSGAQVHRLSASGGAKFVRP